MSHTPFTLQRDAFGQLVLTDAQGTDHVGVVAVRAFPIAAPEEAISLVDVDGHERAWIDRLDELPEPARALVAEALTQREFMPVIQRLLDVSGFVTPSTWQVDTDRGTTAFVLKGEEDIRRLAPGVLIVNDEHGVQYLIRDLQGMDRHSRRLLDRFL
ncbi:MAG: DUF1854 domain-containing protein, partial [Ottowia sp.]|uniref:cyanophycin metabolism-associated DUF1854 family protein n=1 Tax=Ottowia sp. TaxID=1898956 RepID=UPI001D889460|nr:DUF1854 domain-containing protein [Ottowia sp.]MCP5258016.1 DUF1854 domain-containing protein [Burkholderiaceae bacterium]MCB2032597.1 DUF1854 domain-containing protein [Ottowia sp.]MCB2069873.1 DUF1854 domain-containing protein [Ottowia sp.]HPK31783.1 DUF1854 domain-containing protein [Ottowia sp.]HPR43699.1 DUF1854 domain-containing protein [Ottowia sp.]